MIWVGHVAYIRGEDKYVRVLVRKREGERHVNLGTDGRRILKWTLQTKSGVVWNGLIWLKIGVSGRLL